MRPRRQAFFISEARAQHCLIGFSHRHHSGTFILRIDDTDEARSTDESMQGIYDSMEWLGLDWDEGPRVGGPHAPYIQTERGDLYHKYVQQLLDAGNAYHCYCTSEELDQMRTLARVEKRPQGYPGKCRHLTEADRAETRSGRTQVNDSAQNPGRCNHCAGSRAGRGKV